MFDNTSTAQSFIQGLKKKNNTELTRILISTIHTTDYIKFSQILDEIKDREALPFVTVKAVQFFDNGNGLLQEIISQERRIQKDIKKLKETEEILKKENKKNKAEAKKQKEACEAKASECSKCQEEFDGHNVINFLEGDDQQKQAFEDFIGNVKEQIERIRELPVEIFDEDEKIELNLEQLKQFLHKVDEAQKEYGKLTEKIERLEREIAEKDQFMEELNRLDQSLNDKSEQIKEFKKKIGELEAPQEPEVTGDIELQTFSADDKRLDQLHEELQRLQIDFRLLEQEKLKLQDKIKQISLKEGELVQVKQEKENFVQEKGNVHVQEEVAAFEVRTPYIDKNGELKHKIKKVNQEREDLEKQREETKKSLTEGEKKLKDIIGEIAEKKDFNLKILDKLLQEEKVRQVLLDKVDKNGILPIEAAVNADIRREGEDVPYLDVLVKHKVDIKTRGKKDTSIWHHICRIANENIGKIFDKLKPELQISSNKRQNSDISFVHELNKQNDQGDNPLHVAIRNGNLAVIQYINNFDAENNPRIGEELVSSICYDKNAEDLSPITLTVREKQNDILAEILKLKSVKNEIQKNENLKNEIIDECILSGNNQALEILATKIACDKIYEIERFGKRNFQKGTDVDKALLHRLIKNSDVDTIKFLVKNDLSEENDSTYESFDYKQWLKQEFVQAAAEVGNLTIFQHLIDKNPILLNDELKRKVIENGHIGIINYVKTNGGLLFVNNDGDTQLHVLAKSSNPDLSILDEDSIDEILKQNFSREKPIELAVKHNNLTLVNEMLRLYLEKNDGYEIPNAKNPINSALKQAASSGNILALNMLIENHGASIYHTFKDGETLIEVAARGDNPQQTVEYIISEHKRQKKQGTGKDEEYQLGVNNAVLHVLSNQEEQDWHQGLLRDAKLTEKDLGKWIGEKGINPLSRAIINCNYSLIELLNEQFPELKNLELTEGQGFLDKQKPLDVARSLGDPKIAKILDIDVKLEKSFMSTVKPRYHKGKMAEIRKNNEEKKEQKYKQAPSIDLLYEYHGPLEKYAKIIREKESLKDELEKINKGDAKELLCKKSPTGHILPTLVAAYGTVTQWKELQNIWKKIDKVRLPTDHMHDLSSDFGNPLEVAIRSGNEEVIAEIQKIDKNAKILRTATEVGNIDLVRKNLDKLNSIDKKLTKILSDKENLLHIAINNNDSAMVGELVSHITESGISQEQAEKLANSLHGQNLEGKTILHTAAVAKNSDIFFSIYNLIRFADQHNEKATLYMEHVRDKKGQTPLDDAVSRGNDSVVKLLSAKIDETIAENSASPGVINKAKEVKIEAFKQGVVNPNCKASVVRYLVPNEGLLIHDDFQALLAEVAKKGNPEVLDYLLKSREIRSKLSSLLKAAIEAGNIPNIEFLIKNYNLSLNAKAVDENDAPPLPERNPDSQSVITGGNNEFGQTLFDVALKKFDLYEWCGEYLRKNYIEFDQPLSLAIRLGDVRTLKTILGSVIVKLTEQINGKLPIQIAEEQGCSEQFILTLAEGMLRGKMNPECVKIVLEVLQKHGYCQNNDIFSRSLADKINHLDVRESNSVIDEILENSVVYDNSSVVNRLLNKLNYPVSNENLKSYLQRSVELENVETVKMVLVKCKQNFGEKKTQTILNEGEPSLLKQGVLSGNRQLFLVMGQKLKFTQLNQDEKQEWAYTLAKGGMIDELKESLIALTTTDLEGKEKIDIDSSELLHAMLDGGHANKEMIEYYKEKFPDQYKQEMLSPQDTEITKKRRLSKDKKRNVELWEKATNCGNEDLANYLRDDLRKLKTESSKTKRGEIERSNFTAARILSDKLADSLSDKNPSELKKQVTQIEAARARKYNFTLGQEVVHRNSEDIRLAQNLLIKHIGNEDITGATQICVAHPGIFDIPNSQACSTITDYLFANGSSDMKLKLLPYANQWIKDKEGNTPLHRLLQKSDNYEAGQLEAVVSEMIDKGASLIAKNNEGKTSYDLLLNDMRLTPEFKTTIDDLAHRESSWEKEAISALDDFSGNGPQRLVTVLKKQKNHLPQTSKIALRCLDDAVLDDRDVLESRIADLKKFINFDKDFNPFSGIEENGNNLLHILCEKAVTSNNPVLSFDALSQVINALKNHNRFNENLLAAKNLNGETPLDILAKNPGGIEAFKAFERNEREKNSTGVTSKEMVRAVDLNRLFRLAAKYGNVELCTYLLSGGRYRNIQINGVGENDDSALHQAAINVRTNAFEYLLSMGADIDQVDSNGQTVLQALLDKVHFGDDEGSLASTLSMIHGLIASGADLTVNKDKSGFTAMEMIQSIGRSAQLMQGELANLREKTILSTQEKEKLKFLEENENYASATVSLVHQTLNKQRELIKNEEELNHQLKKAITLSSTIHDNLRLPIIPGLVKVPVPFSGKAIDKKAELFPKLDDDFTARIKGKAVQLDIHSAKGGLLVSEFFDIGVVKSNKISICKINGVGYEATVQKSPDGKRNYTVETGKMKMEVTGIGGKPKIIVEMEADGKIKANDDSWKEHRSELRNVCVGGIYLYDALMQGRWRKLYDTRTAKSKEQEQSLAPKKVNEMSKKDDTDGKGDDLTQKKLQSLESIAPNDRAETPPPPYQSRPNSPSGKEEFSTGKLDHHLQTSQSGSIALEGNLSMGKFENDANKRNMQDLATSQHATSRDLQKPKKGEFGSIKGRKEQISLEDYFNKDDKTRHDNEAGKKMLFSAAQDVGQALIDFTNETRKKDNVDSNKTEKENKIKERFQAELKDMRKELTSIEIESSKNNLQIPESEALPLGTVLHKKENILKTEQKLVIQLENLATQIQVNPAENNLLNDAIRKLKEIDVESDKLLHIAEEDNILRRLLNQLPEESNIRKHVERLMRERNEDVKQHDSKERQDLSLIGQKKPWGEVKLKDVKNRTLKTKPEKERSELEKKFSHSSKGLKEVKKENAQDKKEEKSELEKTFEKFTGKSYSPQELKYLKQTKPIANAQFLQAISKFLQAKKGNIDEKDKKVLREVLASGILVKGSELNKKISKLLREEINQTQQKTKEENDKAILEEVADLNPDLSVRRTEQDKRSMSSKKQLELSKIDDDEKFNLSLKESLKNVDLDITKQVDVQLPEQSKAFTEKGKTENDNKTVEELLHSVENMGKALSNLIDKSNEKGSIDVHEAEKKSGETTNKNVGNLSREEYKKLQPKQDKDTKIEDIAKTFGRMGLKQKPLSSVDKYGHVKPKNGLGSKRSSGIEVN
ncbi:MAG: hypothetical protein HRK26_03095 [Rickettsiaceae bacterium H1]|nr:hypothetical protein [Rickettsiaceae bacterium H1]